RILSTRCCQGGGGERPHQTAAGGAPPGADAPLEERLAWNSRQESECRITAIKVIKDAQAGGIHSQLQYVLEYFQENRPNLSVVPNENYDGLELKWSDGDRCINGDFVDGNILQTLIA
ncbi:unnamed protein product, partial [Urochloa humidicola]